GIFKEKFDHAANTFLDSVRLTWTCLEVLRIEEQRFEVSLIMDKTIKIPFHFELVLATELIKGN
ncbi:MAG: hypothetical protein P8J44_07975, partial [Gammaproteobacteria bacterium]|nr:hypothetical protein [Gammaproteobacteria bacterium]